MKAYSQELRKSIVRAVEQGYPRKEVARLFHVSLSTIKRYLKQWKEEGNLLPKPIPGRPPEKLASLQAGLRPQLEKQPDATLLEHCEYWEAREGLKVSTATMSRAIQRLGGDRKKI